MRFLKQSSTAQPLMFLLVQSADHITPLTGATPTVTLSKNGNGFNAPSGAVSEVANGWYKVAGNATDTDTLGPLILHATAASGDPTDVYFDVVAVNPQSANAFITGINSLAPPTDWNLTSIDAFGRLDISKIAGTTQTARDLGASVLLSSGTGTGQVLLSSGTVTLADGSLTTAKLGTFALAKTTNITGFNDIAATDIVSGGAITTNDGIANANTIQIYDSDQAADGAFRAFAYYMDNSFTLPMVASVVGNVGGNITGSIGSLATQAKADVNAEADTALADYDPPTSAEMVARTLAAASYATAANQTAMQGATFDTATDSLEAIRNRGDAAWITATGFSTHSAADVWAVGTRTLTSVSGLTINAAVTSLGNDVITSDSIASSAVTEIQSGLSTLTAQQVWEYATRTLTAGTNLSIPTAAQNADAVWDELRADHTTNGTFGQSVAKVNDVTNIVSDTPISTSGGGVSVVASVTGNISGKVLGGGSGTITGVGVWALDGTGAAIPTATAIDTQLTTSHGTGSWAQASASSGAGTADQATSLKILKAVGGGGS